MQIANGFTEKFLFFSDKAIFYVNAVNKQNLHYWCLHYIGYIQTAEQPKDNGLVCSLWRAHVLRPFIFDKHLEDKTFLNMIREKLVPQIQYLPILLQLLDYG